MNPPAAARSIGAAKQLGLKSLRGLHGAQAGPLRRPEHDAVGVDGLDGVADRQRGHHRGMTGLQGLHHPHDQRGRGERPRRVVDEDELRVPGRREREPDRLRAVRSARHDDRVPAEHELGLVGAVRRHGNHDAVHDSGVPQTVEGVLQHRATAQIDECLRRARGQPLP